MTTTSTLITLLIVGSLFSTAVRATSFVMSTDITLSMTMSSTKGTSSSLKDDKIVLAAKSDAAAFVASRGDIRGVQLEAALKHIRRTLKNRRYSDQQLAAAILTL